MKYEILYKDLLLRLRNRIPQNSKLVKKLVDILPLEKEAVYRRLRQEVPFTFEEIATIAREFNISLDSLFGVDAKTAIPFRINLNEMDNPVEVNYSILEEYVQVIRDLSVDSSGRMWLVVNLLPLLLYTGFKHIARFYYFKWQYYSIPANRTKPYHEIVFPARLTQIANDIFLCSKKIQAIHIVLSNHVFQDFVDDVVYFNSIRLIRDEDVIRIKEDLLCFLDYMETIAIDGFVDEPANEVLIYNSDISVDTSYYYVDSKISVRYAMIWSFIFNTTFIFDNEMLEMIKQRIQMMIRTSTLLSVTDEKQRMEYFAMQRKIVGQL